MAASNRASPERALGFARDLVAELKRRRPEAGRLEARLGPEGPEIGLEDGGEWFALLMVSGGSKACNVMWLLVATRRGWFPAGMKGTPAVLAEKVVAQYAYLWQIATATSGFPARG